MTENSQFNTLKDDLFDISDLKIKNVDEIIKEKVDETILLSAEFDKKIPEKPEDVKKKQKIFKKRT